MNLPPPIPRELISKLPPPPHAAPTAQPSAASSRGWPELIAGATALCAVVGGVSDLAQPIGPFATIIAITSTIAFALVLLALLLMWASRYRTILLKATGVVGMLAITSIAIKSLQLAVPGGSETGALATQIEGLKILQSSIFDLDKKLGRIEGKIDHTLSTGKEISGTTKRIETNLAMVQRASDPRAIALHKISLARLPADGAGYIAAISQGLDEAKYFVELGVFGEDADLRKALLNADVKSVEFANLSRFMSQAHSKHYASMLRSEIWGELRKVARSGSLAEIREAVCRNRNGSFFTGFANKNLHTHCQDENLWPDRFVEFALLVADAMGDLELVAAWQERDRYILSYRPSKIASLNYGEFDSLRKVKTNDRQGQYYKYDALIRVLWDGQVAQDGLLLYLWHPTKEGWFTNFYNKSKSKLEFKAVLKAGGCFGPIGAGPACAVTITFRSDSKIGLMVVGVENIRRLLPKG